MLGPGLLGADAEGPGPRPGRPDPAQPPQHPGGGALRGRRTLREFKPGDVLGAGKASCRSLCGSSCASWPRWTGRLPGDLIETVHTRIREWPFFTSATTWPTASPTTVASLSRGARGSRIIGEGGAGMSSAYQSTSLVSTSGRKVAVNSALPSERVVLELQHDEQVTDARQAGGKAAARVAAEEGAVEADRQDGRPRGAGVGGANGRNSDKDSSTRKNSTRAVPTRRTARDGWRRSSGPRRGRSPRRPSR